MRVLSVLVASVHMRGLGVYAVLMCKAGNPLISVQDVKHFRADLVLVIALCNQGC